MAKKGDELYVRKSKSNKLYEDNQIWDDSLICAAYDRAMNKANEEIAKQIAMETNSKGNNAKGKEKATPIPKAENAPPKVWKEGMPCRAVFFEDGFEYEAVIYAILDNEECVVKFLGYDNSEVVNLDSLLESRGDGSRMRQIEQATGEKLDDGFESQSNEDASGFPSSAATASRSSKQSSASKKTSKKKKPKKSKTPNFPNMPNLADFVTMNEAFAGPTMAGLRLPSIPFPPPPLADLPISDLEQQALSSMLISWYMSGYHTGLYQGLLQSKNNDRSHD